MFIYAAEVSPELAARVEAEMTDLEVAAAATAKPTPYVHEVLAGCRESGRTVAVVSNNSARAVNAYLDRHGLSDGSPPGRRPHQPRPRPTQAQPPPDRDSRPRTWTPTRRHDPRRRLLHRHRGSPPRGNRQHRLRQQTRQARAMTQLQSRSRHHQHGRPSHVAPSPPASELGIPCKTFLYAAQGTARARSRVARPSVRG